MSPTSTLNRKPSTLSVDAAQVLGVLPFPMLTIAADGTVADANGAAESFFDMSKAMLRRELLTDIVPFGSPILSLVEQVKDSGGAINEYRVDLSTPRTGAERMVDIHVSNIPDSAGCVVIVLQERTIADKMDRQLTHRGAARSVSALAEMLAHEIKNPLSGIRGAAQLLEPGLNDDDRALTQLICDETDRIVKLVDVKASIFTQC
jgi:two-component system, NtrC family, nitrogen regulation sensor histidine kinase GlnL